MLGNFYCILLGQVWALITVVVAVIVVNIGRSSLVYYVTVAQSGHQNFET